jgi:hypothetical protein
MESKTNSQFLIRKYSLFGPDRECKKQLDSIIEVCGEHVLPSQSENEDNSALQRESETKGGLMASSNLHLFFLSIVLPFHLRHPNAEQFVDKRKAFLHSLRGHICRPRRTGMPDKTALNLLGPDGRVNRTPPNPSQLATDYSQLTVLQIDKGQPL